MWGWQCRRKLKKKIQKKMKKGETANVGLACAFLIITLGINITSLALYFLFPNRLQRSLIIEVQLIFPQTFSPVHPWKFCFTFFFVGSVTLPFSGSHELLLFFWCQSTLKSYSIKSFYATENEKDNWIFSTSLHLVTQQNKN